MIFSSSYGKLIETQAKVITSINSIRVWPSPSNIRIVFDLSSNPKYKIYNPANTNRIIIDFKDAVLRRKLALDLNKQQFKSITTNLLDIHISKSKKNSIKVILEIKDLLLSDSFVLQPNERYGHRLVMDLESNEKQKILALFDLNQLEQKNLISTETRATTNKVLVAIDPGHGGEDPGAIGPNGTLEKNIVLSIARILKQIINSSENIRAFLTRDGDYYISLKDRILRARKNKADLFISIHADAFTHSNADGASVFVLSEHGESTAAAKWIAESQNKSDSIGGVLLNSKDDVLASVIFDLSQKATSASSFTAAKNILLSMRNTTSLHKHYIQRANFLVLKSPDVPSVLIETGFISNPRTEIKLREPNYQKKIAQSIFKGIEHYFSSQPKRL